MEDPEAETAVAWWIRTLVEHADELREAGVSSLKVGEYAATLLPKPPPEPTYGDVKNEPGIPDGLHPLEDPHSYPGGIVPGFTIEKFSTEE